MKLMGRLNAVIVHVVVVVIGYQLTKYAPVQLKEKRVSTVETDAMKRLLT